MPDEFFKVDVDFLDHPRLSGLTGDAFTVLWACVAYANRLWTDGFVPETYVKQLVQRYPGRRLHHEGHDSLGELVEREELKVVKGGYEIHDYLQHNRSRADRDKQRQQWKDRQTKHRASSKPSHAPVTRDSRVSHASVTRQEVEEEVEEEKDQDQTRTSTGEQSTLVLQPSPAPRPDPMQLVYTAWIETLPRNQRRRSLTEPRRKAIGKALKSYPVEDLIDAVRGWVNDPWEDRPQHNDLPLLLHMGSDRKQRNNLETFRDLARNGQPQARDKRTAQMAATYQQMIQKGAPDGVGRMGSSRGQAQRELPGPADSAGDGGGVVRGAPWLPGGGGVAGDSPLPP